MSDQISRRCPSLSTSNAVSPGECVCREWQKPEGKRDEHHPICRLKSAWEAQLAHSPDLPRERAITVATAQPSEVQTEPPSLAEQAPAGIEPSADEAPVTSAPVSRPSAPPALIAERTVARSLAPAPDPIDCICREWSGTEDDKHHRICEFRERWEREHNIAAPLLIELETGTVAREATVDEADASKANVDEDGVGTIELSDGRLYYVRQP